jgi:integrase
MGGRYLPGRGNKYRLAARMIKNPNYKKFMDKGSIIIIEPIHLEKALNNVTGIYNKYVDEGRALLITLYYTGARPGEVLALRRDDFSKDGGYLVIQMPTLKHGRTRLIYLNKHFKFMAELWRFVERHMFGMYIFFHYKSKHTRRHKCTKNGIETGEIREYTTTTDALRYHFKKWFTEDIIEDSIPPYYLRHNRFSKLMMRGASTEEIKQLKGARDIKSVEPYLHLSTKTARKLAGINK